MYKVQYLPAAHKDIREAIGYVANDLSAPTTARKLYNEINEKIETLLEYPYMYPLYLCEGNLLDEIRFLSIGNYLMFYTVKRDIIEIRRFIYKKRDIVGIKQWL